MIRLCVLCVQIIMSLLRFPRLRPCVKSFQTTEAQRQRQGRRENGHKRSQRTPRCGQNPEALLISPFFRALCDLSWHPAVRDPSCFAAPCLRASVVKIPVSFAPLRWPSRGSAVFALNSETPMPWGNGATPREQAVEKPAKKGES